MDIAAAPPPLVSPLTGNLWEVRDARGALEYLHHRYRQSALPFPADPNLPRLNEHVSMGFDERNHRTPPAAAFEYRHDGLDAMMRLPTTTPTSR